MSTNWGSYVLHERAGIDYSITPSSPSTSDTSVTVTFTYHIGSDGWNFDNTQTMTESADGLSDYSQGFTFDTYTQGDDYIVGTRSVTYGLTYGATQTKHASCTTTPAYNGANPSQSISITIPARPIGTTSAPGAPSASGNTTTAITYAFTAPSTLNGGTISNYELQLSTSSSFTSTVYSATVGTSTSGHTVTGLSANTKYYARVRAEDQAGWSGWSGTSNSTTLAGVPSVPGSLVLASKSTTSLTFSWAPSNANGGTGLAYNWQLATDAAFTTIVQTGTTSGTSVDITGLSSSTTYYFRVDASTSTGTSAYTSGVSGTTDAVVAIPDNGDFATLMNNLATEVGKKLVHLGMYGHFASTTQHTLANGSEVALTMDTTIATMGPDAPTKVGSGVNDIKVNYPGLYYVQFSFEWPATTGGSRLMMLYVNGAHNDSLSNDSAGRVFDVSPAENYSHSWWVTVETILRLNSGDTLGWAAYQTSGSSTTQGTQGSGMYADAKVAMIGF